MSKIEIQEVVANHRETHSLQIHLEIFDFSDTSFPSNPKFPFCVRRQFVTGGNYCGQFFWMGDLESAKAKLEELRDCPEMKWIEEAKKANRATVNCQSNAQDTAEEVIRKGHEHAINHFLEKLWDKYDQCMKSPKADQGPLQAAISHVEFALTQWDCSHVIKIKLCPNKFFSLCNLVAELTQLKIEFVGQ